MTIDVETNENISNTKGSKVLSVQCRRGEKVILFLGLDYVV